MGIRTYGVAVCDLCDDRSEAFDGAVFGRLDMWQILQKAGWTRRNIQHDMGLTYRCPSCSSGTFPGKPEGARAVAA